LTMLLLTDPAKRAAALSDAFSRKACKASRALSRAAALPSVVAFGNRDAAHGTIGGQLRVLARAVKLQEPRSGCLHGIGRLCCCCPPWLNSQQGASCTKFWFSTHHTPQALDH
jgi:hypothetical protein